jgi:hypothetical protein
MVIIGYSPPPVQEKQKKNKKAKSLCDLRKRIYIEKVNLNEKVMRISKEVN